MFGFLVILLVTFLSRVVLFTVLKDLVEEGQVHMRAVEGGSLDSQLQRFVGFSV